MGIPKINFADTTKIKNVTINIGNTENTEKAVLKTGNGEKQNEAAATSGGATEVAGADIDFSKIDKLKNVTINYGNTSNMDKSVFDFSGRRPKPDSDAGTLA